MGHVLTNQVDEKLVSLEFEVSHGAREASKAKRGGDATAFLQHCAKLNELAKALSDQNSRFS